MLNRYTAYHVSRNNKPIAADICLLLAALVIIFLIIRLIRNSKPVKYRKNARLLLDTCEYYINKYESLSVNKLYSCKDDLMAEIGKKMSNDKKNVSSLQKSKTNYIKIAHAYLANASFDLLTSGKYHIYSGVLNPMNCSDCLMTVYTEAMLWTEHNGFIDENMRKEHHAFLLKRIRSIELFAPPKSTPTDIFAKDEESTNKTPANDNTDHFSLSTKDDDLLAPTGKRDVSGDNFRVQDHLIKCTKCGNRISENSGICRYCGKATEKSPQTYSWQNTTSPSPSYPHEISHQKPKKSFSWIKKFIPIAIILALIIIPIVMTVNDSIADSNLTPVKEPESASILEGSDYGDRSWLKEEQSEYLEREYLKSHGIYVYRIASENTDGPNITVTAPNTESCVVKLKTRSGITRLAFYVRAGETVTVGTPNEYLYVYFASGGTWYGEDHLFGARTSYTMDDEICDFVNYSWEYTLVPVSDGNFSETPIDEEEFKS